MARLARASSAAGRSKKEARRSISGPAGPSDASNADHAMMRPLWRPVRQAPPPTASMSADELRAKFESGPSLAT